MQHHILSLDGRGKIGSLALSRRSTIRKSVKPKLRDSAQHRLDETVILEITQEG